MYTIDVTITGTAPLLQRKFDLGLLSGLRAAGPHYAGVPNYTLEWLATMHTYAGFLIQPATPIEAALVRAAAHVPVNGSRKKTYKGLIKAAVRISPDEIPHLRDGMVVNAPDPDVAQHPTEYLRINVQQVIIARTAVARARLEISAGWVLAFTITVNDDQLPLEVVQAILAEAGRTVGIGDLHPRYGRFAITAFTVRT